MASPAKSNGAQGQKAPGGKGGKSWVPGPNGPKGLGVPGRGSK